MSHLCDIPFAGRLLSFLEGSACGIGTAGCTARTYGDLLGSTVGFAVMIYAVFYVAANSLDVLFVTLVDRTSAIIFFAIHGNSSFAKNTIMFRKTTGRYSPQ